jgi:hypothetical protein
VAFAEPKKHYELLLDEFREQMGKDAPLPEAVQAVEGAKRGDSPPYDEAIPALNAALLEHVEVPDSELEDLGRRRARAIQDALLAEGKVDAARVFIVATPSKPGDGGKTPSKSDQGGQVPSKPDEGGNTASKPDEGAKAPPRPEVGARLSEACP